MDVQAWLRDLGLECYEATFSENKIDSDILPDLTDADLQNLGVPLGDRKRLLKAIKALQIGSAVVEDVTPPTTSQPSSEPRDTAERRQLHCDVL